MSDHDREILLAAGIKSHEMMEEMTKTVGGFTAVGQTDIKREQLNLATIAKTYSMLIRSTDGDGDFFTFVVSDDVWEIFNLELMTTTLLLMADGKLNFSRLIASVMSTFVQPRVRQLPERNYMIVMERKHTKQMLRFFNVIGRAYAAQTP